MLDKPWLKVFYLVAAATYLIDKGAAFNSRIFCSINIEVILRQAKSYIKVIGFFNMVKGALIAVISVILGIAIGNRGTLIYLENQAEVFFKGQNSMKK